MRPSARTYAASWATFSEVRLRRRASRAWGANEAFGNVRMRRTSNQWPWTEECQSKQPKKAGVNLRGGATSASLLREWLILLGYSLATQARAKLAKRSAAWESKPAVVAV